MTTLPPATGTLCGTDPIEFTDLGKLTAPEPTDTWYPIPHADFVSAVKEQVESNNFTVTNEQHGLAKGGERYFGLLHIASKPKRPACLVIGLRNGHDKRLSAGIVCGSSVFVCSNMIFTAQPKLIESTRHTKEFDKRLPKIIDTALADFRASAESHENRIDSYEDTRVDDTGAHDLAAQLYREHAITAPQIGTVIDQWHAPDHEDFEPRNLWSFHNAVTQAMKTTSMIAMPQRSQALHRVLDPLAGLT